MLYVAQKRDGAVEVSYASDSDRVLQETCSCLCSDAISTDHTNL